MDEGWNQALGQSTVLRLCQARAASPGLAPGSRDAVAETDQHLQPSLMGLSLNKAPGPWKGKWRPQVKLVEVH